MRFTAVFLVALSAATSGFALSKKGGDGKHFLISSPFSLSSTLTPLLYQLPTTTPASGPAASPAPTASSSSLSTHRLSRPSPVPVPTPTCTPSLYSRIPSSILLTHYPRQEPDVRPQAQGDVPEEVRHRHRCRHLPRRELQGGQPRPEPCCVREAVAAQRRPPSRHQLDPPLRPALSGSPTVFDGEVSRKFCGDAHVILALRNTLVVYL